MANVGRLRKEYSDLLKEPLTIAGASPSEDQLDHWVGYIRGPEDTPFEGGEFRLDIHFPADYPFTPPLVKFTTKIYHPNIDSRGNICLDILKNKWSPCLTITKVLLSLTSLLTDPNPTDPLDPDVAEVFLHHREIYDNTAKDWTERYAVPS